MTRSPSTDLRHVRPAVYGDIVTMAPMLRAADEAELRASCGRDPLDAMDFALDHSSTAWTGVGPSGLPCCVFGVVPTPGREHVGIVWLLGTPEVEAPNAWRWFARESRIRVSSLAAGYAVLHNMVDQRQVLTLGWLEWLGFRCLGVEPEWGVGRLPFVHMARWTKEA